MVRAAMTGMRSGPADQQRQGVAWLRERVVVVEAECRAVRAERDRLAGQVERLAGENQRLQTRVGELVCRVEELQRAAKRQAAPFSGERPCRNPRRPGRKPGQAYGRHARRPVPERVDRVVSVGLPDACPRWGGVLRVERVALQWQEDLPAARPTEICRYQVQVGRCQRCRCRVQPRHPEQTSDALGAAAVQLGPRAVALAAWCSKGLGLPASKVARLLGLKVSAGGVTQAVARAARRAGPTYKALVAGVKASPVVAPDETGWRVAGRRAWLWAFAGRGITVYRVAAHRGYQDAAVVLGEGFAGVLERDGWAPYRKFAVAVHQTCLAHLLRRVGELLADAKRGQAKTPHTIRRILQQALLVRDQRDAGTLTVAEAAGEAERLGAAVDKLIGGRTVYAPNRRLLDHLGREREALFSFLVQPGGRPPTGARSRRSALRWCAISSGAATPPGTGPGAGRCWPACWPPPACSSATRLPCWSGCCARPARSSPTWPSLAWRGARERRPARLPPGGPLPRHRRRAGR
jgi:transposase